jgi:hypothetical protein
VLLVGGVEGTSVLSAQIDVLGTTNGDGLLSSVGAFLVPLILESSAMPVLD